MYFGSPKLQPAELEGLAEMLPPALRDVLRARPEYAEVHEST